MQKVVLKVDVHDDDKCKRKVMKLATTIPGIDSISMDTKEQKLTVTGSMDPVKIVQKLRTVYNTHILSIGPAKEPEKKKESKESKDQVQLLPFTPFEPNTYYYYPPYPRYTYY